MYKRQVKGKNAAGEAIDIVISRQSEFRIVDPKTDIVLYTLSLIHISFHNNYRPQFYLRTMDVTGEVHLPAGVDMVMPGDHVTITVKLIYPVAINEGLRFAIREGGRTVGCLLYTS